MSKEQEFRTVLPAGPLSLQEKAFHQETIAREQQIAQQRAVDQTNPKDIVGETKVPLGLFPAVGRIYGAQAMRDGAKKYGPYNWRSKKVRMTIYLDAIERHLIALRDGEDMAQDSGVHHLGHIIACGALLADALEGGNLIDDRAPAGPAAAILERFREKR